MFKLIKIKLFYGEIFNNFDIIKNLFVFKILRN